MDVWTLDGSPPAGEFFLKICLDGGDGMGTVSIWAEVKIERSVGGWNGIGAAHTGFKPFGAAWVVM